MKWLIEKHSKRQINRETLCSEWGVCVDSSVTSKKSPNVYKSCPKVISLEKLKIFTSLQKLPENVGKIIVAKGFEKLPKVQKIAQCGHTGWETIRSGHRPEAFPPIFLKVSICTSVYQPQSVWQCDQMWLDYLFILGHLQQRKFAQRNKILATAASKISPKTK